MKLKRLACLLLLLSIASTADATGVALRWGSCQGTSNRNFACDRSSGAELLVGSFQPPGGASQIDGIEAILSISAADGSVPSWWQTFENGSCRRSAIVSSFDVTDQSECDDPWGGQAVGNMGKADPLRVSTYNVAAPAGISLYLVAALTPAQMQPVNSGGTYAAFKLMINHQKSGGAGACSGCDVPVCIKLEAIRLTSPGPPDKTKASNLKTWDLTQGINGMGGASQVATWQGGTPNCTAGLAKPSTWSELKARFKSK